jgi:hypothetical protein
MKRISLSHPLAIAASITVCSVLLGSLLVSFGFGGDVVPFPCDGSSCVNVVNEPTVNIGNGNGVNILNNDANPVPIKNMSDSVKQPYRVKFVGAMFPSAATSAEDSQNIPGGKRFVVEYVSIYASASQNTIYFGKIYGDYDEYGSTYNYWLNFVPQGTLFGKTVCVVSQQINAYFDKVVGFQFYRNNIKNNEVRYEVMISGYLIDLTNME